MTITMRMRVAMRTSRARLAVLACLTVFRLRYRCTWGVVEVMKEMGEAEKKRHLSLGDSEDAHPHDAGAEGGAPDSVPLPGVQGQV